MCGLELLKGITGIFNSGCLVGGSGCDEEKEGGGRKTLTYTYKLLYDLWKKLKIYVLKECVAWVFMGE